MTLTPAQETALAVVARDAKKRRPELRVGKHNLNFGIQVQGTLSVAERCATVSNAKPALEPIVAALLSQFGPRKREKIVAKLIEGGYAESLKDKEAPVALAKRLIRDLTVKSKGSRFGNTTGVFDIAVIDDVTA